MADKRDILIRLLGEETVSKMTDRASGGLDRFGDKLEATERDAKGLDDQIREVEGNLKALAVAFSRTQDEVDRVDLTKAIRKQQTELRKLTKARDLLPDFAPAGEEAAVGFAARFSARVGPLLAQAPVSPPLLAAFTAGVPAVIPLISAAVTSGVALASVGAGLKLAFQDASVKAAAVDLKEEIGDELEDAAAPFVPATLRSIGTVRAEFRALKPELDGLFEDSSRYLEPLTRGATGFVRELLPGLRDANAAAEPLIETLGEHGPKSGAAFGEVLRALSSDASYTADSFDGLLTSVEGVLHGGAKLIEWANAAGPYLGGVLQIIGRLSDDGPKVRWVNPDPEPPRQYAQALADAAQKTQTLSERMRDMAGINISAEQASIRLTHAIAAATEAGKGNTDGISRNNAKQAENRQRLVELANAANDASKRIMEQTGSQALATAESQRGRNAFMATARAMGVEAGDAKRLADQLFAIPEAVKTTVSANTGPAMESARSLVRRINNMHARISVSARGTTSYGGGAHTGDGYSTGMSAGGMVTGSGPKGVDTQPRMLAIGEGVLTSGEVDALGGPAGFERLRAAIRSGGPPAAVAAVGTAAGGGMSTVNHYYTINVAVPVGANPAEAGRQVVEVIRAYEQRSGPGWRR